MKDIVVGAITNYNFDKIKPWVNSLDNCGFTGTKAILCYNVDYDTVNELIKRNYSVIGFTKDDIARQLKYDKTPFSIVVERFYHMWYFLKQFIGQYRYIIATDVKDVIFQTNPSEWLEQNIKEKEINIACESIRYKDETWGRHNLFKSFGPDIYDQHKTELIYNAGTLSGKFNTMLDFFLNIYLTCKGSPMFIEGGGGPDQAAVNILINMQPYKKITNFAMSEDGYAAQLGTTGPQVNNQFGPYLVEESPILVDSTVCTSKGVPFCIVHQYDRVPHWKHIIEEKYA
ncbi:MAG: hypothetical protein RLZZ337_665 [Bacteroidota bacterium]|jgi:hypothetical protein